MVLLSGIEPEVSTVKGWRVSQLHYRSVLEPPTGFEPAMSVRRGLTKPLQSTALPRWRVLDCQWYPTLGMIQELPACKAGTLAN